MKRLQYWLTSPFPFQFLFARPALSIGGLSLFIFAFLSVFEPFGFGSEQLRIPHIWVAVIYAVIPGLVILFHRLVLRVYLPFFSKEEQWTLGKELALYSSILLTSGLLNTVASFFLDAHVSLKTLPRELWRDMYHTLAIGLLPVGILTLISYSILLKRNKAQSNSSTEMLSKKKAISDSLLITITSPVKKDEIQFDVAQLLYIRSVGNYLDIIFDTGEKKTVRNSVQAAEKVLSVSPTMFRCHRSYIVNLAKIQSVSGNALGYLVTFPNTDQVPVSRSKLKEFDLKVNSLDSYNSDRPGLIKF